MFIKRNCVWLIAATLVVSNLSQARAGGGFMDKVQEGSQYVNEAKQVEGTAKQIDEKAEGFFKKRLLRTPLLQQNQEQLLQTQLRWT